MTAPISPAVIAITREVLKHRIRMPHIDAETLFEDAGMDELDRQMIALGVEEYFHFEIPDAEMESWASIADVVRAVEARQVRA